MHVLESLSYGLMTCMAGLIAAAMALWIAGALYFDVGRGRWFAWPLVCLWVGLVACGFAVWTPLWKPWLALVLFLAVFLRWWFSQQPRHDRNWNPNFAVLPRFEMNGDVVTAYNVRHTEYQSAEDFTPHYETRQYRLANLVGLDAVVIYWGSPWLCHPLLIFDFGTAGRLCISIEVRYRVGQRYGFLRSLYRQQEIIYVVSDERDAILKRSKHSKNHDVYLYRLAAEPQEIAKVFLEYIVSANQLVEQPYWYHGLTTNCTTSIYRQRAGEIEWDWRWLFNGQLDKMLYDHGRLDHRMPFAELKQLSRVNQIANRAPREGFGETVRRELPGYLLKLKTRCP